MDQFFNYPNLILANTTAGHEFILLNDLVSFGFRNSERPKPLNYERCQLVMENLAKFHAISFAMKNQQPHKFNEIARNLQETIFVHPINELFNQFLVKKIENALTTLDRDDDCYTREKMIEFGENISELMVKCVDAKEDSVICHGDCWISNLMFRNKVRKITP